MKRKKKKKAKNKKKKKKKKKKEKNTKTKKQKNTKTQKQKKKQKEKEKKAKNQTLWQVGRQVELRSIAALCLPSQFFAPPRAKRKGERDQRGQKMRLGMAFCSCRQQKNIQDYRESLISCWGCASYRAFEKLEQFFVFSKPLKRMRNSQVLRKIVVYLSPENSEILSATYFSYMILSCEFS